MRTIPEDIDYSHQQESDHQKKGRIMSVTYKGGRWIAKVSWPGESHEMRFASKPNAWEFCRTEKRQTLSQIHHAFIHCLMYGSD